MDYPIPAAFGEKDVDVNAKELYAEPFLMLYTNLMNKFVTQNYTQAYCLATRKDIRDFYLECYQYCTGYTSKSV